MLACVRPPLASTLRRCNQVALAAKCGARAKESEQSTRVLLHFNVSICYNEADFIAEVLFRMDQLTIERQAPVIAQYDAVVCGGGPAGWVAAVSAARNGCRTALIEKMSYLGGTPTAGLVDPISGGYHKGKRVLGGVGWEFVERLVAAGAGQVELPKGHVSFDPEYYKLLAQRMVLEAGVELYTNTVVSACQMADGRVTHVLIESKDGLQALAAGTVIDATGDGFAAMRAGAQYHIGREQDGRCQPVTIEFLVDHLDESRALSCFGGSDPVTLPDGKKYSQLCRECCERGELPQNVSIVRLHKTFYPGERNVNATQANGLDILTPKDEVTAELTLRAQIDKIIAFLRKYVPGYESCRVKSSAATLGVRETRRIEGLRRIEDIDVETGTRCPDVVVHKAWFLIDIHNPAGGGQAEGHSQPAIPYDIPYGALVPRGVDGMLTAGRCISGTHRAHASYRVMAICLATGQAAGTAAALCAKRGELPRELDYHLVQDALQKAGCTLFDQE